MSKRLLKEIYKHDNKYASNLIVSPGSILKKNCFKKEKYNVSIALGDEALFVKNAQNSCHSECVDRSQLRLPLQSTFNSQSLVFSSYSMGAVELLHSVKSSILKILSHTCISLFIARFLKPSEIRLVIFLLQLNQLEVSSYYEYLCKLSFNPNSLERIIRNYLGFDVSQYDEFDTLTNYYSRDNSPNNKSYQVICDDIVYLGSKYTGTQVSKYYSSRNSKKMYKQNIWHDWDKRDILDNIFFEIVLQMITYMQFELPINIANDDGCLILTRQFHDIYLDNIYPNISIISLNHMNRIHLNSSIFTIIAYSDIYYQNILFTNLVLSPCVQGLYYCQYHFLYDESIYIWDVSRYNIYFPSAYYILHIPMRDVDVCYHFNNNDVLNNPKLYNDKSYFKNLFTYISYLKSSVDLIIGQPKFNKSLCTLNGICKCSFMPQQQMYNDLKGKPYIDSKMADMTYFNMKLSYQTCFDLIDSLLLSRSFCKFDFYHSIDPFDALPWHKSIQCDCVNWNGMYSNLISSDILPTSIFPHHNIYTNKLITSETTQSYSSNIETYTINNSPSDSIQLLKNEIPFELIYKVELLGKICDECYQPIGQTSSPCFNFVSINTKSLRKEENELITVKIENIEDDQCDDILIIDDCILPLTLCSSCNDLFYTTDSILCKYNNINEDIQFLKLGGYIDTNEVYSILFDHGGRVINRRNWLNFVDRYEKKKKKYLTDVRTTFKIRMKKIWGFYFYTEFINKILPPEEFLNIDEKQRKVNPFPWSQKPIIPGRKISRYRNGPYIEKFPLGSLQRSTALLIQDDFNTWLNTDYISVINKAEQSIFSQFRLVFEVYYHPNQEKCLNLIDEYVLTRKIDWAHFDFKFVHYIWRVLHRGRTRHQRIFTGSFIDRQRIEKFFSPCCIENPPVLPIQGYLGFDHHNNNQDNCTS